ncbi:MAG TPA: YihY/virulence factor BrkB family protein [Acidimicrobiales bacterium]|nr:YihY/virulence factor BrkB family protein [Acidimicrobiales bacterium]
MPATTNRRTSGPTTDQDGAASGPARGREADRPQDVPARGWRDILLRTKEEVKGDSVVLLAAGVAFYALLSLVPGLVALVSIYGLVADPADIDRQVGDLLSAAPAEVRDLVSEQLGSITDGSRGGLGVAAVVGVLVALWSASSGMKHLITAINTAYDEEESRGFLKVRGLALALTVGAMAFLVVALGLIAVLPAALAETSLGGAARVAVSVLRWPLLGLGLLAGLAILYRWAPDRDNARWAWTAPGTIFATVAWVVASIAFSIYTANFGSYGETYGSLGAVVVVMLWLLISALVVVVGAEVNAEAERQTRRDTTAGRPKPLGRRQAVAADTVGGAR